LVFNVALLTACNISFFKRIQILFLYTHCHLLEMVQDYLELLRSNRLTYAGRHNYCYCEVGTSLDFDRHPHWTKVKATSLLLSFADTVMHIDADALIVNHSISIESIMESTTLNVAGKDVIYTTDFTKQEGELDVKSPISSVAFIMRNTPWSKVGFLSPCN
jgi:hypothetical protein